MFGIALELYGDMIDEQTGEHIGRPQQATSMPPVPRLPGQQPPLVQTNQYPSQGGQDTGRRTYPSEKQTHAFAIPIARAAGLDWETQQDDIIFAVHGKRGPLYRNDEWNEVQAWMEQHKGFLGQWEYNSKGHLIAGPDEPGSEPVGVGAREDSMDDVPFD
jgi:hypothetical protein